MPHRGPSQPDLRDTGVDGEPFRSGANRGELADNQAEIDDVHTNIAKIDRLFGALLVQQTEDTDRQSRTLLQERLDQLAMEREWEWCQVGHLEALSDEKRAVHIAHCNVMQLKTAEHTTLVSDLLQLIKPNACEQVVVQAWDKMNSPIGFSRFYHSASNSCVVSWT